MLLSVKKVREEGREGEPGTVRVSPANKTLFIPIRHRRLAGRDPTARRWSPKAKYFKADAESGVHVFSFMHLHALHGEVYLYFLRVLCVLCGKTVLAFFVNFRAFRG